MEGTDGRTDIIRESPSDCLYSKTCRRDRSLARSPPPLFALPGAQWIDCPPSADSSPCAATHGQRVNQLESEPRSFCSLRVPRPVRPVPCSPLAPLLGSSSARLLLLSPLWYSPPLHVRGKNGFKRSISDSLPRHRRSSKPPRFRVRAPDPQVVSTVRKWRGDGDGDGNGGAAVDM